MKKIDLLHTTIRIVAVLCGYQALKQCLALINMSHDATDIFYARSGYGAAMLPAVILIGIYGIVGIVLIKNGGKVSRLYAWESPGGSMRLLP